MNHDITIPAWATHIVSDLTDMDRNPHKVDAGKVSRFTLELPDDAYFEYAFLNEDGTMRADPDNATRADNPWYAELSALSGPAYQPDPYAVPLDEPRVGPGMGKVRRHRLASKQLEQTRRLTLYTPRGHEDTALPCVIVQDGTAYLRVGQLHKVMEAMLQQDLIRPAHLVFAEPIDRNAEYPFNPGYRAFICEELIPFVANELNVTHERVAMGASLGGLCSATLALEHPELFATVVTQSGAFLGTPERGDFYRNQESWVLKQLQAHRAQGVRWYTEVGTLEWLTDINRQVAAALEEGGYTHTYLERHAGHNWVNWRNGLSRALRFALGRG